MPAPTEAHICKFESALDLTTLKGWRQCKCGKKQRGPGVPAIARARKQPDWHQKKVDAIARRDHDKQAILERQVFPEPNKDSL